MVRSKENNLMVVGADLNEIIPEVQEAVAALPKTWDEARFIESPHTALTHLGLGTAGVLAYCKDLKVMKARQQRELIQVCAKAREINIPSGFLTTRKFESAPMLVVQATLETPDNVSDLLNWLWANQRPHESLFSMNLLSTPLPEARPSGSRAA